MKPSLYIIYVLLLINGFAAYSQDNEDTIAIDHYRTNKFDGVIFPNTFEFTIKEGRFTPLRNEIDIAEKALNEKLKALNKPVINQGYDNLPVIHRNLNKYKRQYIGYLNKKGEKILFINCFWDQNNYHKDWKKRIIFVLDGGSYYWSVKFNLTTGELFDLSVNGVS